MIATAERCRRPGARMQRDLYSQFGSFSLADAPPEVVHQAKRCLLDLVGVAAAGRRTDASRIAHAVARSQFGGGDGMLLFDGATASAAGAAFANATTIDSFDAHDGHPLTKGHAGCGCLAAVVGFAGNGEGISGADALAHLILGYELAIRAGIALHATASDYHTSGAWVALAAAAIGARMLKLPALQMREAIGIAEYNGPRSQMMRCIDHPTMIKDGSGWGAMVGAAAAVLARGGFTGAPAITLEGADVASIWADFGQRWRITEQYFKPHPVCRWAQPAMEAAAALRREHGFDANDITAVTVRTFQEASCLRVAAPASTEAAQYSLPFPLAALLVRGSVGPAELDGAGLADPDVLRVSGSVKLVEDARYSALFPAQRWAEVDITLADGRVLHSPPSTARGSADSPLSDGEISEKFHRLMEASGAGDRAHAVEREVMALDSAPSLAPLLSLICQPVASSRFAEAAQ